MKKLVIIDGRTINKIQNKVNEVLSQEPTAEIVGVSSWNARMFVYIQYEVQS